MASKVADLLVVAHLAAVDAKQRKDTIALEKAVELAWRAITHPAAPAFFAALDAAGVELNDVEGNDPDILSNETSPLNPLAPDPDFGDEDSEEESPDEDSDAASPADEGLVNHASFGVVKTSRRPSPDLASLAARLGSAK